MLEQPPAVHFHLNQRLVSQIFFGLPSFRLRIGNHKHAPRSNDMGFNFTAEFGMAMEQGSLEAQTERVSGLCLLAVVHAGIPHCRGSALPFLLPYSNLYFRH